MNSSTNNNIVNFNTLSSYINITNNNLNNYITTNNNNITSINNGMNNIMLYINNYATTLSSTIASNYNTFQNYIFMQITIIFPHYMQMINQFLEQFILTFKLFQTM